METKTTRSLLKFWSVSTTALLSRLDILPSMFSQGVICDPALDSVISVTSVRFWFSLDRFNRLRNVLIMSLLWRAGVCKKEEDICISGRWSIVWVWVDGIWKPWVPGQRSFRQSPEAESVGESETTPCLSS